MIARLLGLTAVSLAAAVGLVPASLAWLVLDNQRRRSEQHWDWDTAPSIAPQFDRPAA